MGDSLETRFWEKVNRRGEDECWNWIGATTETQPGKLHSKRAMFAVDGKTDYACRVLWRMSNGEIPKGMWVLHECDNSICINPKHLYLGTPKQNTHDMIDRGRFRWQRYPKKPKPPKHPRVRKLSESDVGEILRLRLSERKKLLEIARLFNINPSDVSRIMRGQLYKDIIDKLINVGV